MVSTNRAFVIFLVISLGLHLAALLWLARTLPSPPPPPPEGRYAVQWLPPPDDALDFASNAPDVPDHASSPPGYVPVPAFYDDLRVPSVGASALVAPVVRDILLAPSAPRQSLSLEEALEPAEWIPPRREELVPFLSEPLPPLPGGTTLQDDASFDTGSPFPENALPVRQGTSQGVGQGLAVERGAILPAREPSPHSAEEGLEAGSRPAPAPAAPEMASGPLVEAVPLPLQGTTFPGDGVSLSLEVPSLPVETPSLSPGSASLAQEGTVHPNPGRLPVFPLAAVYPRADRGKALATEMILEPLTLLPTRPPLSSHLELAYVKEPDGDVSAKGESAPGVQEALTVGQGETPLAPGDGERDALWVPVQEMAVFVEPIYPRPLRRQGIEGYVEVLVRVGRDGEVLAWEVTDFVPVEAFKEAVNEVVPRWRFVVPSSQAKENGEPFLVRVRVEFRLD